MKNLDSPEITAKCVEISKCLLNKETGFQDFDLDITKSIGNIARFATNIRQAGTLEIEKLAAIGVPLKISYPEIRGNILIDMQDLGWIQTYSKAGKIQKIDEYIPPLHKVLKDLGTLWAEKEPTKIDEASVNSLAYLSKKPATKEALISDLDIDESSLTTMLDYGEQTSYLGTFYSETFDEDVVWTPFYWAGKMSDVIKFLGRQSYESLDLIGEITEEMIKYPGRPLDRINSDKKPFVDAGIGHGYFPSIAVKNKRGELYEYIFPATPQFGAEHDNDIFEKARLIVGCIRHGQYHADITKIMYPVNLLRALRSNSLGAHSYAIVQYALLIANRICTYEEVPTSYGIGYKILFIDTPENQIAADIAEEMLMGLTPSSGLVSEPEAQQLLVKGTFDYTAERRQIKGAKKISAKGEFDRLMESLRGSGVNL